MNHITKLKTFIVILILSIPIIACQAISPVEPTATVELTPTIDPTPTVDIWASDKIPVSLIGQITGTWMAEADLGNYYIQIHADGTLLIASTIEALEDGSAHSWKIWMEKSLILAGDYVLCSGDIGTYFAGIGSDGVLKFTTIYDPCSSRTMLMDKSQHGRLDARNLLYTRVE